MSTHPDDRTISVTSLDPGQQTGAHRVPLGPDGQPIFPPAGDASADPAYEQGQAYQPDQTYEQDQSQAYSRAEDDRRRDAELAGGFATDTQVRQAPDSQSVAAAQVPDEQAHVPQTAAEDQEWQTLQLQFVDDPAAAVRAAADRVEREFAAIRSRLESAGTEELRTAFRRFRELSDALR